MQKDLSEVVACVIDRGTFFPVAQRLARDYKKVYYHRPNGESFKTFAQCCMGTGHPDVEYCPDFWQIKSEVDLFVFPDVGDIGVQLELMSQGFPVWGSKGAGDLEECREKWMEVCQEIGLPMPPTEEIVGLTNLKLFLKEHDYKDWFVKISRFRGDMETWEARGEHQVNNKLSVLDQKFGPFRDTIKFYVQQKIETEIEAGSDTYNVHGLFPQEVILGYEKKAESYFATVKKTADMAPEVWSCSEKIQRVLAEHNYSNFVSSEVRVADGESFWLDPCFRCPSPAGEEQLEMYENFGEIVWQGAHGVLVQPRWAATFCGEAIISYSGDREGWKSLRIEEDLKPFVKLYASAHAEDGVCHFPQSQDPEAIGCAVGMGDSPAEVLDMLKDIREALKGEPVTLLIEPLADLFKEIQEAEKQGIEFTEQPLPEVEEVLE